MKVHLVFDSDETELAAVIQQHAEISGWDYTFDTAAQWAASKKGESPDVILASGTCDISTVDLNTGEQNRNKAIIKRLTEIRVNRPESRVIILLPPEKENSKDFLAGLVSLGIYDIYFINEFNEEDIQKWLHTKKALPDVQQLLPEVEMEQKDEQLVKVSFKNQKHIPRKEKIKEMLKITPAKDKKQVILLATGDNDINESISTSIPCRAVIASSRESLPDKILESNPNVIILSYLLPGEMDILEVAHLARESTDKVIFMPGNTPENDITLARIKELGVEVLPGDISIGSILRATCSMSGIKEQCDEETEEYNEPQEGAISKFARVGSEIVKNIPSVSVPKFGNMPKIRLPKKQAINEKLLAVVSPLSAGKTFISVNLSTTLAGMGYTVALVDADIKQQAVHAWLNMDTDEVGLIEAMNSDEPLLNAFQHPMVSNLYVFSSDPGMEQPLTVNAKGFLHLCNTLQDAVDIIVVDTGNINDPLSKRVIDMSASTILVADVDYSHLIRLQVELDRVENTLDLNKFSLMVNRVIKSDNIDFSDAEKAAGLQAEGVIPEKSKEVLESIKSGLPAALFCPDIKAALADYWERRGQMISWSA